MVSVIVPVYNVEKYIGECLESLANQTYKDLQIIIVNDGSTDRSMSIINQYLNKFSNIEIITQRNMGVAEARNNGLKKANGEYTLFIDPDDFMDKRMIEVMCNSANENDSDVVLCGYYLYYSGKNLKIKNEHKLDSNKVYDSNYILDKMLKHEIQGQLWNKLFKTEFLIANNFNLEKGRAIEDVFPVFKLISKANKITYINELLYYYRQNESSIIHVKSVKIMDDYYYAMSNILKYVEENNIPSNSNSIKIFKVTGLLVLLKRYQRIYGNKIYTDFKDEIYYKFNLNLIDIVFLRNFKLSYKIKLILWKLKLFNIYYDFKLKLVKN